MKTIEMKYRCPTYKPIEICFVKGEGVWLYDGQGKKYIDCLCAYGATNFGHCDSIIKDSIIQQIGILNVVSGVVHNDRLFEWFETTKKFLGYEDSILLTSGTEAVDATIKFMRLYGKRKKKIESIPKVIVFKGNYHGQSNTIISFSDMLETRIIGNDNSFIEVEYDNVSAFKNALSKDVCGVLVEPIQCQNGFRIPQNGFLSKVQKICNSNDIIFAIDEVQTGLGRTGELFAYNYEKAMPDIVIIGKSLGGGILPVSSILMNTKVASQLKMGDHGGTFANNTLSAHVASHSIRQIFERNIIKNSKEMGAYLLDKLSQILSRNNIVVKVYGIGLLICVELDCDSQQYCEKLLEYGVFCKATKQKKIRVTPPLSITKEECNFIISAFNKVFNNSL